MSIIHHHPFKAFYVLLIVAFESARFPLWILKYIFPAGRPNPSWSFRQAMGVRIVKAFLQHISSIHVYTPTSLRAGWEGKRWAVMQPAKTSYYKGPTDDKQIRPTAIGGTWYPKPYGSLGKSPKDNVCLHFHGGAFIIGDGREGDAGHLCRQLSKHADFKYVFAPQYRLSSNPGGRFPSQLQDAITSYTYLLHTLRIPAERIVLSGDSAGGNLALALLRYINEYGGQVDLPQPAGALLWSPWVNVQEAQEYPKIFTSPHYSTDYLTPDFSTWGANSYSEGHDPAAPYISPLLHPLSTPVPIWIQTGGAEVLYFDNVQLAESMQALKGNQVELHTEPHAPHDIALIAHILGFNTEYVRSLKQAAEFMKRHGVH